MRGNNPFGDGTRHAEHFFSKIFTLQKRFATAVDDLTLLVHHVVVFEKVLSHVEVAAFNLTLRILQRL